MSLQIVMRKHLPRRTVLRGMGATLALPFLDGMLPAFAGTGGAGATSGTPCMSYISTGPNFAITGLILLPSPTATTSMVSGLMYFLATRCTSSAVTAMIFEG